MAVALQPYRFTVDQYHRMGEAGIFSPDSRVELIDGEIFEMTPVGPWHAGVVNRLTRAFAGLGDRAIVHVQNPVGLDPHSEPLPDLMLLRPRADFYGTAHRDYRERQLCARGRGLAPVAFPDLTLQGDDILGSERS